MGKLAGLASLVVQVVIVSGKVGNVEIHSSSTTDLLDSPCNPTMFLQELEWSDEHQNTRSSHGLFENKCLLS